MIPGAGFVVGMSIFDSSKYINPPSDSTVIVPL